MILCSALLDLSGATSSNTLLHNPKTAGAAELLCTAELQLRTDIETHHAIDTSGMFDVQLLHYFPARVIASSTQESSPRIFEVPMGGHLSTPYSPQCPLQSSAQW
jgi:hypothetical protein